MDDRGKIKVTIESEDDNGTPQKTVLFFDQSHLEVKQGLKYGISTPFGTTATTQGNRIAAQLNLWSGMDKFSMEQAVLDGRDKEPHPW